MDRPPASNLELFIYFKRAGSTDHIKIKENKPNGVTKKRLHHIHYVICLMLI